MDNELETKTDLRVHEVMHFFKGVAGWKILHEIDSINYGEGYDLDFCGVPVRLYDEERSDAVMAHPKFVPGKNWDVIFCEVQKTLAGQVALRFEVDRFDRAPSIDRQKTLESITQILKKHGLQAARAGGAQ